MKLLKEENCQNPNSKNWWYSSCYEIIKITCNFGYKVIIIEEYQCLMFRFQGFSRYLKKWYDIARSYWNEGTRSRDVQILIWAVDVLILVTNFCLTYHVVLTCWLGIVSRWARKKRPILFSRSLCLYTLFLQSCSTPSHSKATQTHPSMIPLEL